MTVPDSVTVNVTRCPHPVLDHERLDVYRTALDFHALAVTLLPRRASLSIVLTIAEGVGPTAGPDKRRFYAMARGSATECAALLDVRGRRRARPRGTLHADAEPPLRAPVSRDVLLAYKRNSSRETPIASTHART